MAFQWYPGKKKELQREISDALEMTAEAIRTDLIAQQTVPFAEDPAQVAERKTAAAVAAGRTPGLYRSGVVPGELQGSLHVDRTRSAQGTVSVVASTPYARRLYFHPEYNYYRGTNPRAGGLWFEPYKKGRRQWVLDAYAAFLRIRRGA